MILVSDASGQTNLIARPSGEVTSVPMRANDISMGRVREAEYRELTSSTVVGDSRPDVPAPKEGPRRDPTGLGEEPGFLRSPPGASRLPIPATAFPKTVQTTAGRGPDRSRLVHRQGSLCADVERLRDGLGGIACLVPEWPDARERREDWRFKAIEPAAKRATGQDSSTPSCSVIWVRADRGAARSGKARLEPCR